MWTATHSLILIVIIIAMLPILVGIVAILVALAKDNSSAFNKGFDKLMASRMQAMSDGPVFDERYGLRYTIPALRGKANYHIGRTRECQLNDGPVRWEITYLYGDRAIDMTFSNAADAYAYLKELDLVA